MQCGKHLMGLRGGCVCYFKNTQLNRVLVMFSSVCIYHPCQSKQGSRVTIMGRFKMDTPVPIPSFRNSFFKCLKGEFWSLPSINNSSACSKTGHYITMKYLLSEKNETSLYELLPTHKEVLVRKKYTSLESCSSQTKLQYPCLNNGAKARSCLICVNWHVKHQTCEIGLVLKLRERCLRASVLLITGLSLLNGKLWCQK